jgi:hypothetical protein
MLRRQGRITGDAGRSGRSTGAGLGSLCLIGAALLLGGCQLPPDRLKAASIAATQTAAAAKPKPTPLAATPAVARGDVITPTARLTGDPKELMGLDQPALRRALGDPARIRNEDPAQVWQYVTGDCIVDLYLYAESGALKVTYVEARSHTAETAPTGRCLKSLLERPTASAQ